MATTVRKGNHGANVRRWREWRNINQDVLAEQIGISQTTLSVYEKKEKLEQEILEKLAKALDIPVEAITELEEGSAINIVSNTITANDNANAIGNVNAENYQPSFNPIDKIVALYDEMNALHKQTQEEKNNLYAQMLKEKDSVIAMLQEIVKSKK